MASLVVIVAWGCLRGGSDVYPGAQAAAPAPSILDPSSSLETSGGGTFDRLAKLAQRATESVAANIGAAQDDSGPVLGTLD